MTGFGRGVVQAKDVRYVVEVRSVNNRFCEVRFQAPKDFLELEHVLAARIRDEFDRGKFDLFLKVEPRGGNGHGLDEAQVIRRWRQLERIRKKLGLAQPVRLETVLTPSAQSEAPKREDEARKGFLKASEQALAKLRAFRLKEGGSLARDILRRLSKMKQSVDQVAEKATHTAGQRLSRLKERVSLLLDGKSVDSGRLEMELALLADKSDVTEEIVRLRTHLATLIGLLNSREAAGRKIDFLLQEIHREVNTIGSKASDLGMTEAVVFLKAETEKIREQAQNLE
jgi:uncharacterized protein (TIGR00255 family)